ncbi:MAG: phenylalanine--tRNA ligase subunit beta [Pseudomonadales bacterium]|nr:phenylalanine--tRNA ligase subunit beta [Pseudomonadales bacterium]
MIVSEQWLRRWVNPAISTQELMAQLTMAGLEVDSFKPAANAFTGVIVAEVVATAAHPDADKLRVCQVNTGADQVQVVCGAANVRPGLKVPYACIGARLAADFKIKKARLRGVDSFGMLCSAQELGLAEHAEGLLELASDAPVGQDIRTLLDLDDTLIEVDLTPNRGDCLSIAGLAREVGVLNRMPLTVPELQKVPATITDSLPVELLSPSDCPRYLGRVIRNVNPQAASPQWLSEALRRSGIRSIDPIVDVTNYVLMELGQPMHAFDLDTLQGGIRVRKAHDKEKLVLLDGQEVSLDEDTLVIADHRAALAMAGIMGGQASSVTAQTHNIFLESAFFSPLALAGRARSYGLQTDAAHRFERGVDFNLPRRAMERASELLLAIVGGEAGPITEAVATLPDMPPVSLRAARINSLLGLSLPLPDVEDILGRLGLKIIDKTEQGWTFAVPSWRFDISLEEDLIEEVARIYGYDRLPVTEPLSRFSLKPAPETVFGLKAVRSLLADLGYQEVVTYSFVEAGLEAALQNLPEGATVMALANPLSQDMAHMRSNLWAGLIKTLKHNQNRQQNRVRLFESGLRFFRDAEGDIQQSAGLAGLIWGNQLPEQWGAESRSSDFFDMKGDLETIFARSLDRSAFTFRPARHPALQQGISARILRKDSDGHDAGLGWLGALDPVLQRRLDIPGKVFLFELELAILTPASLPQVRELSRFPSVRRDIALVVDAKQDVASILSEIRHKAGDYLSDIVVFDVYQGENIAKNKKSLAVGLTWQHPSRTLNDLEINDIINSCIKVLEAQFNAELR